MPPASGPFLADEVRVPWWRRLDRLIPRPRRLRRIRPTREGGIFFATALAVAGAALNTGNNLLYLVFALMLGWVAVYGVLSEIAIQRVRIERRIQGRVFAGRPAEGTWTVSNPRARFPALGLVLEERPGPEASLVDSRRPTVPWLPAGETTRRRGAWIFGRRGLHRLRTVRVSTTFPFGILRKWYDVDAPLEVIVLPEAGDPAPPERSARVGAAESPSRRFGRGAGEFLGLREHRAEDGMRAVHWRSTARLRRRMVAERAEEAEPAAVARVDPSADAEAFERSLATAVGTVLDAERRGAELRVHLLDAAPLSPRSRADRDAVLRRLALLRVDGA